MAAGSSPEMWELLKEIMRPCGKGKNRVNAESGFSLLEFSKLCLITKSEMTLYDEP